MIGSVVIPDYFGDYPVKRLAKGMFQLTNIADPFFEETCNQLTTELTLPKQLEEIGSGALCCMVQLKEIVIPDSVTQIETYAFRGNKRMTRVVLPKDLKEIPEGCFQNTALSDITWPNALEVIGFHAFHNETVDFVENGHITSELCELTLPDTVKSIGDRAFAGRENLRSVNVLTSLESLGGDIFEGTAWYEAQPDRLVYWGDILYRYKGTMPENTVIELSPTTKGIAGYAFSSTPLIPHPAKNLIKIMIPDGVKLLGTCIFSGCSSLTEVVFPRDLERIPKYTFLQCRNLKSITLPLTIREIDKNAFTLCDSFTCAYYEGSDFRELVNSVAGEDESNIEIVENLPLYYYSETAPTKKGHYWHYVDGKPTPWNTTV